MESSAQHLHSHHHHLPPLLSSSLAINYNNNNNNSPSPPSSSSSSSCYSYGVSSSSIASAQTWTPNNNSILNSGSGLLSSSSSLLYQNNNINLSSSSRNHHQHHLMMNNICNTPSTITQDLTFHHWSNATAFAGGGGGAIKQELSSLSLSSSPSLAVAVAGQQYYCCPTTTCGDTNSDVNRGRFSQIYPTINVPSLINNINVNNNNNEEANSSSLGMNNMQALDLFNSPTISEHQHLGMINDGFSNYGFANTFDNVSAALFSSSNNNGTIALSSSELPKRQCNVVEPKPPHAPPKKSRIDSRASCPPFKVRKEKLGDRIAALQQLVAPFGKTDTASVLMEAIGYIKFLQNQVGTLSVPYMKSSRNKTTRAMQGVQEENIMNHEESRKDLRSRGLCLVPLSCLSYVTDSGGGVWPPPNFGGS